MVKYADFEQFNYQILDAIGLRLGGCRRFSSR